MSERAESAGFRERIAGKWQIPLLVLAVGLLTASLLRIERPDAALPVDWVCDRIAAEIEGRMYTLAAADARKLITNLADREDPEAAATRGRANLLLARAIGLRAREAAETGGVGVTAAQDVLDGYRKAEDAGLVLDWQDHQSIALAYEWLDRHDAAVGAYRSAIRAAPPNDALDLRKRVIELSEFPLRVETPQVHAALDSLLRDLCLEEGRLDLLEWAVQRKVDLLCAEERFGEALTLLADLRPVVQPTPRRESFEYVVAWVLYRLGRFDEAEAALRSLRNRLAIRDEVHARSGWLLGRVVLSDGGPQRPAEALSFFRDVISAHATGLYVAASRLGLAEALASLERYDEALEQYGTVVDLLPAYDASPVLNREVVRASMTVVAAQLRQRGRYEQALAFLAPAVGLVDRDNTELLSTYLQRLGDWRAALARRLQAGAKELPAGEAEARDELFGRARELLVSAAQTYLELARVNTLNEPRSAAAAWRAADLFDEAGDRQRAVLVLREFVRERPGHSLVPRALLRLGQSLQAMGRFEEAIEAYQENYRRFPRTPDAGSALVPLARCFLALGPERQEQAEKTLRIILDESPVFTPQAPEFADALFMLADLYSRQGRFEEAIPRFREALERYPGDARVARAEFLLADAYRQSALALREDLKKAEFVGERRRLEAEHRTRLQEAAELFGQLVRRFEDRDEASLGELERLFLRYGRLYEADCWFEMGRHGEALKRYERAAWVYRDTPSALAAYMQIINCHVYRGEAEQARAALRRARRLLRTVPDEQFRDVALNGSRAEWEQYFNWIDQTNLF